MDIKWKDFEGNILNADNEKIIYFEAKKNIKTTINKDEVKKIVIEDRIMNIFKDFKDDLIISIVVPKKNKKDSVKIFNKYDKTGKMFKGNTGNFLIDLILESSLATGHPLTGIAAMFFLFSFSLLILVSLMDRLLGNVGVIIARIIIIGYPIYLILLNVYTRIERNRIKGI